MEPAAGEGLGRLLGLVVIFVEQLRRTMHDLAVHTGRAIVHLLIDDARLHGDDRTACRSRSIIVLLRLQDGGERRDLGLPIAIIEAHARQFLAQFLQHRHRHDRSAIINVLERAQVAFQEIRMAQQTDPDRRRREEGCDLQTLDQFEHDFRHGALDEMRHRADHHLRHGEGVHLRGVIERQRRKRDVIA